MYCYVHTLGNICGLETVFALFQFSDEFHLKTRFVVVYCSLNALKTKSSVGGKELN